MKESFLFLFDLIFPPHGTDGLFARVRPEDFYEGKPRWPSEIYPSVQAIFPYRDEQVKSVILALKRNRDTGAARIAGYAFARYIVERGLEGSIVVPMPISRKRRRERGYNQCEVVADALVAELKKMRPAAARAITVRKNILERAVHTGKFAVQGRRERLASASGRGRDIFRLKRTSFDATARIIVIDDVVTTGTTMAEALRTLRQGGVREAIGIGLAH